MLWGQMQSFTWGGRGTGIHDMTPRGKDRPKVVKEYWFNLDFLSSVNYVFNRWSIIQIKVALVWWNADREVMVQNDQTWWDTKRRVQIVRHNTGSDNTQGHCTNSIQKPRPKGRRAVHTVPSCFQEIGKKIPPFITGSLSFNSSYLTIH